MSVQFTSSRPALSMLLLQMDLQEMSTSSALTEVPYES